MTVVTPTDRPKSVRNRWVIEVFGGLCVLSFGFRIFCWYRVYCHRTESDLLLFLLDILPWLQTMTRPLAMVNICVKYYLHQLRFKESLPEQDVNICTIRRTGRQTDGHPVWFLYYSMNFAVSIITKPICIKQNVLSDIRHIVLKYIPLFEAIVIYL